MTNPTTNKPNSFAGITGKQIGDKIPGPEEISSAESTQVDEGDTEDAQETQESTEILEAEPAQQILDIVDTAAAIEAPVEVSLDTATDPPQMGVVASLDQQPDADTTIVHGEKAQEQMEGNAFESVLEGVATIYSSHPARNFGLGRFHFENSQLRLETKDVAEFEALLDQQPLQIKNMVRKIDVDKAQQLAKSVLVGRKTSGIDTTANALDAPNARQFGKNF